MLTSYSRVTVVSGTRRVDLALPSGLPVADVVPQVLRFCAPEESHNGEPAEFTLARIGGQSLSLSQSLAETGVHDGDVIELRSFTAEGRAAFVEDVRDAIEDSVDGAGGAWTSQSTVTFTLITTCGVLLLLLAGQLINLWLRVMRGDPAFSSSSALVEGEHVASAAVTAVILLGATWIGTRWAARWTPYFSLTVAALWAFVAGTELTSRETTDTILVLTTGVAAAAVLAGLGRFLTARATPLLAAATVTLAALLVIMVADEAGADIGTAVRVVASLAVLSIGVMPRLSIAVGGLSSADYRVRNAGRMSAESLAARFQESAGLLLGSVIGVSVVAALIGFWLGLQGDDTSQDAWDRVLSLSIAATLLLRSRVFSRIQFMLAPRLAGVFVLLASVTQLADEYDVLDQWLYAAIAAVGAAALGVSITRLSDVTRARTKRILNLVEFIVVVDLVVVTMGAVGLYDYVRGS
jgi:type VII secretion integral membrane protein EccD